MGLNPRGTFSLDLSLFGSRITDIQPTDLPAGVSPDNENCWFQPGMVATRPRFQRLLQTPIAGNPSILSATEYQAISGALPTVFLDSNGSLWINDPVNPTVTTEIATTIPGLRAKFSNSFGKLFAALYSPTLTAAFAASPFVGGHVPVYYNGQQLNRVTTDAPGATPAFQSLPTTAVPLAGAGTGTMLTVTGAVSAGEQTIYPPPQGGFRGPVSTYWTEIVYTAGSAVPAGWLNLTVSVSGLVGTNANVANITGRVIAVAGSTFTLAVYSTQFVNLSAQTGSATQSNITYLARQGNIVTVWIGGTSLPQNFNPGYWISLVNSSNTAILGPAWTITAISRDTTGLVTVTINTALTNLPTGAQLYLQPAAASFSGNVAVTNGSPVVSLVSGTQFTSDLVGQAIVINSITYQVLAVASATVLQLASPITSTTGTYAYSAVVNVFPTGFQTVYQVVSTGSSSTTFTFQSLDTNVASGSGGTVYQQWSPMLGTNGNAAQILTSGIDPNNGAFVQFFQLGPDALLATGQGNISSPQAQLQGQIQPGQRSAVCMFLSNDGAITAPSQIVQIQVPGGTNLLFASQIPIGPSGTAQRLIAFTPSNGSNFYYLEPATLLNVSGQGTQIVRGTIVPDNTTVSQWIDFSDSQLTAGTQIDTEGNDLFNQIVLPPCLGVMEYSTRLHWWGAINNVRNLLNMGFDGGYIAPAGTCSVSNGSIIVTYQSGSPFPGSNIWAGATILINGVAYTVQTSGGSTLRLSSPFAQSSGTYPFTVLSAMASQPTGWTSTGSPTLGSSLSGAVNGFSCALSAGQTISQSAYQDEFGAPIALPNQTYIIRCLALTNLTGATFTFTISSALTGFSTTAILTPALGVLGWYTATFSAPMPVTIPTDLTLSVSGAGLIDELELIYAAEPVESTVVHVSYSGDEFGYDDVTGLLEIDSPENIAAMFKQRGFAYMLTDLGLFQTQDNGQTEPDGWKIVPYASNCGCSGPNAVDTTEDIAWWAGRYGGRIFNGNPSVKKITQEIAQDWESMNWNLQTLLWVRNDPVQRVVYFGVVQGSATTVNAILPMNYRLMDDAYNIPDPVHVSMYSGKMLATDLGRKWTLWTPGMNDAAMCTRGGARQIVFAGSGFGNLYTQDVLNYPPLTPAAGTWKATDDDFGTIAQNGYTTYFFYDHLTEQNPVLGLYRKFFDFVGLHLNGIGKCTVTPYVDALSQPWPAFPAFTLQTNDTGFDYHLPWNVRGDRMALKITVAPQTGQTDAAFMLTHVIVSGRQDMVFPVRGSIL